MSWRPCRPSDQPRCTGNSARDRAISLFYADLPSDDADAAVLSAGHALEAIRRATGPVLLDGAEELCRTLGHRRLAIELAAAYLKQSAVSAADYLELLTGDGPSWDAHGAVARICQLSIDRIGAEHGPLAEGLLRILSWYGPADVPVALLYIDNDPDVDAVEVTSDHIDEGLAQLAAYALVSRADDVVSVHPEVHAAARTTLVESPGGPNAGDTRDMAGLLLLDALPGWADPAGWPVWEVLLPHIEAFAAHVESSPGADSPVALWDATAHYLLDQGIPSRALGFFERALHVQERGHGPDDQDTLSLRHSLGHARLVAGDHAQAIVELTGVLADQEGVLGPADPDVLTTRNSLAGAYSAAGEHARAIALYRRTIAERGRVLGRHHPDTLASRNDLATAYTSAGDFRRATRLFTKVAAGIARVNGPDHPDAVISRGNLAIACLSAGRPARAVPLLVRSLADHERVLGRTTRTPWPRGRTSPRPTRRPATSPARSHCSKGPSLPDARRRRTTRARWSRPPGSHSRTRRPATSPRPSHSSNEPRREHARTRPATSHDEGGAREPAIAGRGPPVELTIGRFPVLSLVVR